MQSKPSIMLVTQEQLQSLAKCCCSLLKFSSVKHPSSYCVACSFHSLNHHLFIKVSQQIKLVNPLRLELYWEDAFQRRYLSMQLFFFLFTILPLVLRRITFFYQSMQPAFTGGAGKPSCALRKVTEQHAGTPPGAAAAPGVGAGSYLATGTPPGRAEPGRSRGGAPALGSTCRGGKQPRSQPHSRSQRTSKIQIKEKKVPHLHLFSRWCRWGCVCVCV